MFGYNYKSEQQNVHFYSYLDSYLNYTMQKIEKNVSQMCIYWVESKPIAE